MIILLCMMGAVVALILVYFLFGWMVAEWLDSECVKMSIESADEVIKAHRCKRLGLHADAEYHLENSDMLRRNVAVCERIAGWLR